MRRLALLLLLVALLTGCRERPSYSVVREGGWGGAPPAATGEVLLTLVTPDGRSYDLDRAALERLTWVRRTTRHHPHETDPPATFEGVLLEQLIRELRLEEEGLVVRFVALDDYRIDRPWAELAPLEPILALVQDGRPLTVKNYGPVRVILPYDRLEPDPTRYNALWVWQVRVVEFHY
jgi:hypothetical protein